LGSLFELLTQTDKMFSGQAMDRLPADLHPNGCSETIVSNGVPPQLAYAYEGAEKIRRMETVGQMSDQLSHDFNNLIQIIVSALRIVERRSDFGRTGDLSYVLNSARQAVDKATMLTHRLVAAVQMPIQDTRPILVGTLLVTLRALLQSMAGRRVKLDFVLSNEDSCINCDPRQLENAIVNLVTNARDSMPDGGRIRIEISHADLTFRNLDLACGRYLVLSVSDTGCGMVPEVVRRAFDPFFSTKPLGEGSGLGLPSVKAFVERHRGYIEIHSIVGQGTCVRMYLPY
jgi:signal transduction histidine kinase